MLGALYELFASDRIEESGTVRLSRAEATRLIALEAALPPELLAWRGGERLREMARRLGSTTEIPQPPVPKGLKATLRPYQVDGYAWLQFLGSCGLSGVLADDMGLGKTIQALAHIQAEKEAGRLIKPCLVVAPTSLIPTGATRPRSSRPRSSCWSCTATTAGAVRGDPGPRRGPHLLRAHAARPRAAAAPQVPGGHPRRGAGDQEPEHEARPHRLPARRRAPLGAHRHAHGEPPGRALVRLQLPDAGLPGRPRDLPQGVPQPDREGGRPGAPEAPGCPRAPFLLRRTKEQVASELPPKEEMVREIDLAEGQRDLYESVRLSMHRRVREEIEQRGLARSNIAILEALLKLRQVCCDPRLLKNGVGAGAGASSKFEYLMEQLPAMVETGRRVIVFSQFVEMLDLIDAALTAEGIPFLKLTGQTKDRETPVARFQAGEVPIFLISLRAGGVGITLTAADTVIHYDPWWNPPSRPRPPTAPTASARTRPCSSTS
jgi:hypothetical protein